MVFLVLLLVILALAVLLWVGTAFFQGYIYTEPAGELYWRAPAVAGGVGLLLILWCLLDYNHPGSFDTLFSFSASQTTRFNEFWCRKQLTGGKLGPEVLFKRQGSEFRNPDHGVWKRADQGIWGEILLPLDGTKVAFAPELTAKGTFKIAPGAELRYHEVNGSRTLAESDLRRGELVTASTGLLVMNILLNFLHLALWFAGLWLVLQFQWPHALGLAIVVWLLMTLTIVPLLLSVTRDAAQESARTSAGERGV